jgi:hypothetical protein
MHPAILFVLSISKPTFKCLYYITSESSEELLYFIYPSIFIFVSTGVWTRGLTFARWVLYHLSHALSSYMWLKNEFWDSGSTDLPLMNAHSMSRVWEMRAWFSSHSSRNGSPRRDVRTFDLQCLRVRELSAASFLHQAGVLVSVHVATGQNGPGGKNSDTWTSGLHKPSVRLIPGLLMPEMTAVHGCWKHGLAWKDTTGLGEMPCSCWGLSGPCAGEETRATEACV